MTLIEQLEEELTSATEQLSQAEMDDAEDPTDGTRAHIDYWRDEIYWVEQRIQSAAEAQA